MNNLHNDINRFNEIGEKNRMDLKEFIKNGQLGQDIKIPIKIIELPEFEYDKLHQGGIGKGDAEQGDPVDTNESEDGDGTEPGDESSEHGYYDMNPEEFSKQLDEELGLDFEPKGRSVTKITEGDYNDTRKSGPKSTLDKNYLFKQAIKRHAAIYIDEEYIKEILRVKGYGIKKTWVWCSNNNIPISKQKIKSLYSNIENKNKYNSITDISRTLNTIPPKSSYKDMKFRQEDERYLSPEVIEKPEMNAVVVNIRDVSGSMRKQKRELVERILTPMDWYLQGKYENVEFVYIAHDSSAWEVNREEFFGIKSGGGTRISSAYELLSKEILSNYPWESWNRYIFAAGDGENTTSDTRNNLIPYLKEINATKHCYIEVQPNSSRFSNPEVADKLKNEFSDNKENYRIVQLKNKKEIINKIKYILDTIE